MTKNANINLQVTPSIKRVHDIANIYILKEVYKVYAKHSKSNGPITICDVDFFFQKLLHISNTTFSNYASGKSIFGASQRSKMLDFANKVGIDPAVCNGSKLILLKSIYALTWGNTNGHSTIVTPSESEWLEIEEAYWDHLINCTENRKKACAFILSEVREQVNNLYFNDINLYRFYIWLLRQDFFLRNYFLTLTILTPDHNQEL